MSKNNMFKFITEYNSNIGYICNNFIDFLNKNKINFLIPIFNFILDNKGLIFLILIVLAYYYSKFILFFLNLFLLFDSIILSLLIIQNNLLFTNSRRLAKNVILIFFLHFNIMGSLITFLISLFIYLEFSKFINKIIFKLLKLFIIYLNKNIPLVSTLYPIIKDVSFDNSDNTISESTYQSKSIKKKKKKKNIEN